MIYETSSNLLNGLTDLSSITYENSTQLNQSSDTSRTRCAKTSVLNAADASCEAVGVNEPEESNNKDIIDRFGRPKSRAHPHIHHHPTIHPHNHYRRTNDTISNMPSDYTSAVIIRKAASVHSEDAVSNVDLLNLNKVTFQQILN